MDLQNRIAEQMRKRMGDLLVFAVLLGFGFFINQGVELKGLYMDDLYLWSCYGNQSFTEYVFPIGGTRFRFIFYLASWLELVFLGNHVEWMAAFNIVLNALIAFTIYRVSVRMSQGRKLVSLVLGLAYLQSRMAYYQIGQFYGLMESLGLWAAVGLLFCLYRYVNGRDTRAFFLANLFYFLASFIHERYMVLFPVLLLALLFGSRKENGPGAGNRRMDRGLEGAGSSQEDLAGTQAEPFQHGRSRGRGQRRSGAAGMHPENRAVRRGDALRTGEREQSASRGAEACPKWVLLLVCIGVFALIQGIRLLTIGTLSPAGTGGTDVADTFKLADAIGHAWEQVGFVFGRNCGPDYLCTMTYEDTPEHIRRLILGANGVLAVSVVCFLIGLFRSRTELLGQLKNVVLFLAFIALCIGSSSVTIRVEMRWVYVVYAAALLFLAYMSSQMGKAGILVLLYAALLFPVETFYRGHWDTLYLWPPQMRYNSLAEQTYGTYGDSIFDKKVYIIGNTYEMSEFTAETFLKVYDRDGKAKDQKIQFIDSDFDFKKITDDMVILSEDTEHDAYLNVTDFVKKQRFNRAFGSYEDGWVDENSKIVFMNGNTDKITLRCYYPGTITGNEVCTIRVNGKKMPDLVFTENSMTYEIAAAPYQTISLELSCNFFVANAKETRGEENLAMIVKIKAD